MSDKSPKALHKLAEQKKHHDEEVQHEKELTTEAVHHPVSGHPTTEAEAAEAVEKTEAAAAQE